jgi:hypothetical protein
MLSTACKIKNLNPLQWRRLSELAFGNPPKRIFLIHEGGKPVQLWKDGQGALPLPHGFASGVPDAQAAADSLKAAHPDVDEAWVIDPAPWGAALSKAQGRARYGMDLDAYALLEWQERLKAPGHAVSPQSGLLWRGMPVERVGRFVEKMLPESCAFVLGVFDGDALWASLIVEFEKGQAVGICTTDALPEEDVKDIIGRDQHPFFLNVVANTLRRPAFGWFVERVDFEAWMKARTEEAKEEIFQKALMQGRATFDFNILVARSITAFSPINPGESAVLGTDREENPRTRTPDPGETPPTAF